MSFFDSLSNLYPTKKQDLVQILDDDFIKLFPEAQITEVRRVEENAEIFDHTIEDGSVVSDYKIINPVGIDLLVILNSSDYQSVYFSIRQYWIESTIVRVQTKTATYENQIIKNISHTEVPEMYNAIGMVIVLRQAQVVKAEYGVNPALPAHTNTVNRGQQQPKAANVEQAAKATAGTRENMGNWKGQFSGRIFSL